MNRTAGVPAGVTPSRTGRCAAYAHGASVTRSVTIEGCKVTGQIIIDAGTVTIEKSDLSTADEDGAGAPVRVEPGAGPVTLSHDTLHGVNNNESGSMAWAVWDNNGSDVSIDHVYVYNGDRLLMNDGPSARVTNSFCWANAEVGGNGSQEHYECIYTPTPENIVAKDNVLLNLQPGASAAFFVDGVSSGGTVDLEGNLLAGGSYCVYGGSTAAPAEETVVANRFSRAIKSRCGTYGTRAYMPGGYKSSGNIWDASARTAVR